MPDSVTSNQIWLLDRLLHSLPTRKFFDGLSVEQNLRLDSVYCIAWALPDAAPAPKTVLRELRDMGIDGMDGDQTVGDILNCLIGKTQPGEYAQAEFLEDVTRGLLERERRRNARHGFERTTDV